MPNVPESVKALKKSTGDTRHTRFPRSFGKQAYLPISEVALYQVTFNLDFAKKICKVRNFVYLCGRQIVVSTTTKYIRSLIDLGVSLSASAFRRCDGLATKGVRPLFIHTITYNF